MSKNISVKINSGNETVETVKLNTTNKKVIIKAQPNVNYELVDDNTQYAPETIDTKRIGNDLHIAFEGTDINQESDLVLEGYYENNNTELLLGKAENGQYYAYVPQSGVESDAVTLLAEQVFAPQALGGNSVATPFWAFNPNWLWAAAGVAAVGGIIAAASGSSGSSSAPVGNSALNDALAKVKAAEAAETAAEDALAKANKDGVISQQEADELKALNAKAAETKAAADEAVKALPADAKDAEGNTPAKLQARVDVLDGITVPAVTDANNNGIKDSDEAAIAGALEKVKAAEAAETAAEDALAKANKDGVISQQEADELKALNAKAAETKAAADEAVKALPADAKDAEGNTPAKLQARVDVLDGITVPAVTDANNNGIKDSDEAAIAGALEKVKAAEAAETAAEDALAKANKDGVISQQEADELKALNAKAAETKAAADEAVKALPADAKDAEGNTPAKLQARVDVLDGITVPAVTDANNNGIKDSDEAAIAGALEKVKAAEAAETAAEDALAKANKDGVISQQEADELKALNAKAAETKAAADEAVKALPADAKDAEGNTPAKLQARVDVLDGITVPAVTDANNNGIKDSDEAAIAGALEKVKAAEAAETAAEDALAKANKDGVISQQEADELKALNAKAAETKAAADEAVKALPADAKDAEGNTPAKLQARVDVLDGITVPAVTDANNNGIKDSDEAAIAGALEKVKAAEAAETAAEDALAKANKDGVISQQEADELKALNAKAAETKAAADEAVKALPADAKDAEGNTPAKLQARVDVLDGITVPAVTDANNNGIKDSDEAAIAGALEKVKAAEAAETAAEDALAKANKDGVISQQEADELKALNAKAAETKAAADEAVKALPADAKDAEGNTPAKLQARVDVLDGITVPAVTDANNNGIKDSDEAAIAGALEKVKAAEAAETAAEDALAKANKDGVISQQEADELKALNAKAAETKAAADEAVKALPADAKDAEGNTPAKLQARVDVLDGITVPAVTDANNNGIKDSDEAAIAGALEKVKAAEAAETAAEDALAKANKDGVISQQEADELKALNAKAAETKAAADEAVKALPADAKDAEGNTPAKLQARVDVLDGITVPAVTDANNNGIKDSDEAAIAGALEKVKAAEAAETAAEDALAKANKDGVISQQEADELKALNAKAAETKAAADEAVKALPADAKDAEGNTPAKLQARVDVLDGITVPAVTDANNNGIKDSDEAAIAGALEKVKAAEAAETAAEDALAKANKDGVISQQEADELKALNAKAAETKAAADEAVKALPADAKDAEGNTPAKLQARVDVLDGITVPAVTDANNNGIKDSDEAAIAGALEKVKAAEAAETAAEDALAKANKDGVISQQEADELKALNAKAAETKAAADEAVKALPADAKDAEGNTPAKLQARVDVLDGITVPAVTDANNNGIKDSDEAAIAGALEKVKAAEAAETAAEDALAKANKDGVISQQEADELKALNAKAAETKAAADEAVKALPADAKDAEGNTPAKLQARVDVLDGITVPAVTDANNNGIKDSDEAAIAGALEKVKAAEAAETAAEDALAKANKDGVISQQEADELKALNAKAAETKAAADEAVKALPADAKDAEGNTPAKLQARVDVLDGITVPAVTDANNNGIKDSDEAAIAGALEKVKAAEAAETAAEDALAKANKDGVISQQEADELKALNAKAAETKAAADEAVKALPADAKDAEGNTPAKLQARVDVLDGITVPAVTDANNNGIKDSDEAAIAGALEKVKAAEAAETAAEDALAKANKDGVISQQEADELKALNAKAAETKAAADEAVKALPADAKDAEGNTPAKLQARVDVLDGITVPAVTDANNNGIKDSDEAAIAGALEKVKAAEAAETAAEDALAKANKDGVISQQEADELKALNAKAAETKAAADEAVKALPADAKDAEGNTPAKLQARVDVLDGITVPAVTDANNNGIKDSDEAAIAGALEKVKAAEAAETAAEDALAKANKDGVISQQEADELKALNAKAAETKAAADEAVKALPADAKDAEGNTPAKLQARVDVLDGITVPAVTDANNNGIKDSDEAAIAGALEKVKAAEAAETAAEDALAKANKDGVISQQEADELKALNAKAAETKAAADEAVKALPADAKDAEGNTPAKLQARVDVLDGITVPAVTDANNNGIKDSDEAAIAGALEKVKAAEAAETAAEDALAKANKDGVISQQEADELKALNAKAAETKAAADEAVKALPADAKDAEGNTPAKLQARVDVLDGITVPAVTDANNNGIKDSDEAAIAGALEKVKAAEAAETAAEDALAKANKDGVISQQEADELKALNAKAAETKAAADEAVKALPADAKDAEGNTPAKLQARVDVLDGITVPAVTDANNNGIKDSDEAAIAGALEKVKAAEAAETAAEDALAKANKDGVISQQEADELKALNAKAAETKAAADEAVKALPADAKDAEGNTPAKLQARVDVLDGITVPAVTDANNNGIKDSDEAAIAGALEKVKAAEAAETAAEDALAKANKDGVISQQEADELKALNAKAAETKAAADEAVKALPADAKDAEGNTPAKLQARVDVLDGITVPAVTDANNNGIKDSDEAAIAGALEKVKAAEAAETAAEDALAKANKDGVISQQEADELKALNAKAAETKAAADEAVKALPADAKDAEGNTPAKLQARVDVLDGITVPAVTDANNNGIKDSDEAAIAGALEKVKAAEAAETAAEDALAKANKDGVISQQEADELKALNAKAAETKAAADEAVKALPADAKDAEGNTPAKLQARVDVLDGITVPAVTDANNNGIKDSDEAAIAGALEKVKAAEAAETAAEDALAKANKDGVISQQEADELKALNAKAAETKAAADEAVKALPADAKDAEGNTPAKLQARVDVLDGITVPAVTDANNNGIKDSDEAAIAGALEKVKAAEAAETAAEDALAKANKDGVISQQEADELKALNAKAAETKAAADEAVKALPADAKDAEGNTPAKLQARVDVLDGITVPAVTDANNNGIKDSDEAAIAGALEKVKAAEAAETAAEDALAKANKDGVISQQEADELKALNAKAAETKAAADEAVKALPADAKDAEGNTPAKLQARVDVLDGITVPAVTDANNNGIKDSDEAAIAGALEKVKAAEAAETAAEDALAKANKDGVISQQEADELKALNAKAAETKAAADEAVKALPADAKDAEGNTPAKLQARVDVLDGITVPAVTDANNNGIKDSDEAAIAGALEKVKAAEAAETAAEDALAKANKDGVISQQEADELKALNAKAAETKAAADEAVKALPADAKDAEGNTPAKLQARVDVLDGITVPAVTDANNNGIKDSDEAAIAGALEKVKAAEAAETAAEDALAKANKDGVISQQEADELKALNAKAAETKAAADEAVKALPADAKDAEGNTPAKLQARVDVLDGITVPAVTDANNNGIKDSDEAAIAGALEKVKAAEAAETAAEDALAKANKDGVISQQEADELKALNAKAAETKAAADEAVKALPADAKDAEGNTPAKLQARVDVLDGITVPAVTDANNNGIKDSDEAAIAGALEKVKAAEAAETAAEDALAKANKDGVISQQEADELKALNAKAAETKAAADEAVKALPADAKDAEGNTPAKLQARVDVLDGITVPAVTDANNNGIKDSDEAAIAGALEKVKAAEAAETAAEDALAKANKDGVISQQEADELKALNAKAAETKAAADEAVKALPADAKDAEGNTPAKLQARVDVLDGITVPAVTDANNNGIKDSDEAAIAGALEKVKAAEAAETAAEDALAKANKDGVISQQEADELKALNAKAAETKAAADEAVKALPADAKDAEGNTPAKLQARVDVLDGITVPAVTDANNNGIKDSDEAAIAGALEKVKAAEAAETAAEDALAKANKDGVISQQEADELKALNAKAAETKAAADEAVKALPADAKDAEGNTPAKLQARVDVLDGITVPAVTDANNNGIKDSDEAAIAGALEKVKAAEAAETAAEDALAKANKDGVISQQEADELKALNAKAAETKAAADEAVKALPADAKDAEGNTPAKLQARVDVLDGITVPAVTDANNNGIKDSDEAAIAGALEKVKAAEAAETAAEDALAKANKDGVISQQEADELKALNAKAAETKAAADEAVKALPADAKDAEGNTPAKLQARVDVLDGITVPAVTDANNNGIKDSDEAAIAGALEKVKAAEAAETAAEDALAKANKDGVISQQEADELKALNAKAAETKAAADEAVKALPADAKDAEGNTPAKLQARVDVLDGITVPAVTDANNNGIKDSDEAAIAGALEKVKAAEAAETAAEDALAKANKDGVISQQEADELKALNAKAAETKAAADEAVKALPADAKDAEGNTPAKLQARVDVLDGITVPAVTDANNNGIKDSDEAAIAGALEKVKAAEAAETAAEDALAKANKDGVISQQEADELKALNAKAAETKAAADEAVKALPADAKDAEGNTPAKLQARVDVLDGITVPAVTDANNNGIKDSDEAAIAGALEKVKAAEAAETAAEDALAKANKDGVISQQEADELKALNAKAAETKAAADEAVKALPADAKDAEGNTPAKLQARVDVLDGITVPAVTDANNNGIKDSDEAAIAGALEKVKAAEAAETAAEDALAKANKDGVISQQEADELKALNAKAAETKAAADEAVKALPADAKDAEGNTPAKLQARVDVLDGITVPAVTDANNNGIKDSDEAAIAGALEKVKAAEAAETAAEDALAKANKDGVISQQEADELKALNAKAAETKAAADEAVKALPADAKDAEGNTPAKLQARVDVLDGITVPAVTDANNNGIKDSDEAAIAGALEKVKAAEAAETAAEDALAKANKDGVISQQEADELKALNAKAAETKAAADEAVKALPADAKDAEGNTPAKLQARVDVLDGITVPAVTEAKVTIVNYADDYGSQTGTGGTNTKTDDNTPTIKGTTTLPSSTVHLYEINLDGAFVKLGSTTADSSGNWSYTPDWLTNREHKIYASSTEITSKEDAQSSIVIDVEGVTTPPTSVAAKGEYWSATTVGDINGDGYDDIGMGSWIGNKADAILGGKNLTLAGNNYIGSAVWHQAGVGDVNGDGYNDVLFGNGETGGPAHLYTGGPNGLTSKTNIGNGIAAAAGDVNGDGIVDMIVMGATSSNVYYGSTNGSYTNKSGSLSFGYNSGGNVAWGAQQYAAGVGDFNGDGYNDVVTTNGIYFGSATGLNNSNKISFNHGVTSANAAGDVNGDGYADVVVVDGKYGNSYVLFGGKNASTVSFSTSKGNGSVSGANGGFAISTTKGSLQTADYSNAVGVGDVNGDGLADVLITTYGNTGNGVSARGQYPKYKTDSYIVYGKAGSDTVDPSTLGKKGIIVPNNQADGSSSVGMVDVNGDGLADIYVNSYNTSGKLFYGGSSLGAEPTVQGSGEVRGNAHSNFIAGSQDNDTIYGEGGADIIYAGSGDDRIVLNANNLHYLSEGFQTANADGSPINEGKGRLARIDGGNGHNTLAFDSDVTEVDLTKIDNVGTGFMKTAVGMSRIANIDHIDLTNGVATKLVLEAKDVLDMNPGLRSYDKSSATHQLMISGEGGDTVTIKDVGNWNKTSTTTIVNGETYDIYTSTSTNGAQLLVETDVHVEFVG